MQMNGGSIMTISTLIKSTSENNPFISNQDLVCDVIISEILSRSLKCGDHLSQSKLSTEFNLSRGPIKQALEKLESAGYLIRDEAGSFYVNKPDLRFSANVYSFKRQLDLLAANQAVYDISEEQLKALHQHLLRMIDAFQRKDFTDFCRCDNDFHMTIVEASLNSLLKESYLHYQNIFHFMSVCCEIDERLFKRLLYQHQKIFISLKNRQRDALQTAIDAHYSSLILF